MDGGPGRLTPQPSDVQDVSDDGLAAALRRLVPGQLEAAGAEGRGPEPGGGLRQLGPLADGETGAGLVGAGAVLSDALVDGLVLWNDPGDGERPGGRERRRSGGGASALKFALNV